MKDFLLERIKDHFQNPRNQGEIADPDLVLEGGSIAEGNAVKLMLKLDEDDRICEAKFQSFGACESIAAFSILTELLIGKTMDEAASITEHEILERICASERVPMCDAERALYLMRQTHSAPSPSVAPNWRPFPLFGTEQGS